MALDVPRKQWSQFPNVAGVRKVPGESSGRQEGYMKGRSAPIGGQAPLSGESQ